MLKAFQHGVGTVLRLRTPKPKAKRLNPLRAANAKIAAKLYKKGDDYDYDYSIGYIKISRYRAARSPGCYVGTWVRGGICLNCIVRSCTTRAQHDDHRSASRFSSDANNTAHAAILCRYAWAPQGTGKQPMTMQPSRLVGGGGGGCSSVCAWS